MHTLELLDEPNTPFSDDDLREDLILENVAEMQIESLNHLEIGLHPDLAASLFHDGAVSLGKASKLSGLSMSDFIQHLGHLGIDIAHVDETTPNEAKDLSAWLS